MEKGFTGPFIKQPRSERSPRSFPNTWVLVEVVTGAQSTRRRPREGMTGKTISPFRTRPHLVEVEEVVAESPSNVVEAQDKEEEVRKSPSSFPEKLGLVPDLQVLPNLNLSDKLNSGDKEGYVPTLDENLMHQSILSLKMKNTSSDFPVGAEFSFSWRTGKN